MGSKVGPHCAFLTNCGSNEVTYVRNELGEGLLQKIWAGCNLKKEVHSRILMQFVQSLNRTFGTRISWWQLMMKFIFNMHNINEVKIRSIYWSQCHLLWKGHKNIYYETREGKIPRYVPLIRTKTKSMSLIEVQPNQQQNKMFWSSNISTFDKFLFLELD